MTDFIPFSRPSLDEQDLDAIREVLRSGWITTGPKNQELEAEFSRLTGTNTLLPSVQRLAECISL